MGYIEEKIKELELQKRTILEQIRANIEQERREQSSAQKILVQEEGRQLKQKYEICVADIARLRKGEPLQIPLDRLRSDLATAFHKKLHLIDFDVAETTFKELLSRFQDCDGAMILVQSSEHRMGRYYFHRVRELLTNRGGIYPIAYKFTSNDKITKDELIARMCRSIGLSDIPAQDTGILVQIVQQLLNCVDAGKTLFLEIDCEEMDLSFIKWLIHDFWTTFKNEMPQIGEQKGRLRVIIFLVTHFEFECDDELIPHICHELHTFHNQMVFEIPLLANWEERLIRNWLFEQLADELDYYGYPRTKLSHISQKVMKITNGSPREICNELTGTTLDWLISQLIFSTKTS